MENKTFVLGVGAQKAGTTWLFNYLKSEVAADTGFMKEYHIWDAVHAPESARFKVSLNEFRNSDRARRRWLMQSFSPYYFHYFTGLLKQPGITVTADVTPSYATLNAPVFERISKGFEKRGIEFKVVFLMRDPVERCWSAVRMYQDKLAKHKPKKVVLQGDALMEYYGTPGAQLRTRYDRTIGELEKSIPAESIFYGFYEDLFEDQSIDALSEFIGLPSRHEMSEKRFKVSGEKTSLDPEIIRAVANEYADVYRFCSERFPKTKNVWSGFDYLADS